MTMIELVEVNINNKKYKYNKDTTLQEIAKEFQSNFSYPILLAKINNTIKELTSPIKKDATIEFLDLTDREGNRCHINCLTYIMLYAVKKLYGPSADIRVRHSLDKGLYIETTFKLTENKVELIKDMMKSIIKADMPISKVTIERLEAIKYFESTNDFAKAGVMNYNTDNYITLYRLGNLYNYFYSPMPTSTELVKDFDLTYIKDNGLILRFPTVYITDKIKKYEHHPNMFEVFKECRKWAKIIHIENSVDLNKVVSLGRINDLIKIDETLQSNRLLEVAKTINQKRDTIKIVLLAGPSSSGKTTTSKKLCLLLKSFGLNPKVISMDDYFVERTQTPKDKNGNYDYECLEALDLKLFDKQIGSLLRGEEIIAPTYNFTLGKKEFKNRMHLNEEDIIVIEGIHALDTKILTNISKEHKFKIYISPLTELNIDNHNRISTTDNRLLRRIIRDSRTRNYSVEQTLAQWPSVRKGEEEYIFPYQDEADIVINSATIYEIGVLKTYVEPLLFSVPTTSPFYEEAMRLLRFLRLFLPIPADTIPQDAIIREFIGNSYFND